MLALSTGAASAAPAPKVDICHRTNGSKGHNVINVSQNAVAAHLNHGDSYAGIWWSDADGDGYGAPGGRTEACPEPGFVKNKADCNDGAAGVNPGAAEVCGDQIDNNCSGQVDEGCAVCPCFAADQVSASYAEWLAVDPDDANYSGAGCDIYDETYSEDGYSYSTDYTYIYFYTSGDSLYSSDYYYSIRYDSASEVYCIAQDYGYRYDHDTGEYGLSTVPVDLTMDGTRLRVRTET